MTRSRIVATFSCLSLIAFSLRAQTTKAPANGTRYPRLAIRNATIIDGNGTPAAGPKDIIIENNRITAVIPLDPVAVQGGRMKRVPADVEIDATGKYVLPGLINAHAHTQDERGGIPQPIDYELKIWLSCGITTVRDVGSDTKKTLALKAKSAAGQIAAPRFLVYPMFNAQQPVPTTPEEARARIREYKEMGADGVKFLGMYRNIMEAAEDEAHKLNLPSSPPCGRRGNECLGRHSLRNAQHRALVRHSRRSHSGWRTELSRRTSTTTTKPTASAMQDTCGGKRIRRGCSKFLRRW